MRLTTVNITYKYEQDEVLHNKMRETTLGGGRGRGPGQQQLGDGHAGAQAENNLQRQRQTFRSKKDYTTRRNGQKYRYLQTDIGTDKQ